MEDFFCGLTALFTMEVILCQHWITDTSFKWRLAIRGKQRLSVSYLGRTARPSAIAYAIGPQ